MGNLKLKAAPEELADPNAGQVRPGTEFGEALTCLARQSEIIVEIGTWRGLGSTLCLAQGLERDSQRFYTVEFGLELWEEAKKHYDDPRINFIYGTLVMPGEWPEFSYPDPSFIKYYEAERLMNQGVPYVLDQLPDRIDLLLLDASSWSGRVEFLKLWERSKIIAMDDIDKERTHKNEENRRQLIDAGWKVLADRLDDRTGGWGIYQRP